MPDLSVEKRPNVPVFVLLAALVLCLVICGLMLRKIVNIRDGSPEPQVKKYPIARHVQYSFTLQNGTSKLLEKTELRVVAPIKKTSTQLLERLHTSHPYEPIADDSENQTLCFIFRNLAPYATKIIEIEADLLVSDAPNAMTNDEPNGFLRAERFIESDDPAILRLAHTLKARLPFETAENIFRWVAGNIRYVGYLSEDRGALYAIKNKQGDCSEFAYLFAALCRANSIPARVLGGYVCSGDTILKPAGYHNWAEFYLKGAWHVADPQRKVFMKDSSQYVAMHVRRDSSESATAGFGQFRLIGEGVKVSMSQ